MAGDKIQATGKVVKEKGGGFLDVEILNDLGSSIVMCKLSGKMKQFHIRILAGDIVDIEIDPYNTTRGIIKFRRKLEDNT